jgi:hypothetical protein
VTVAVPIPARVSEVAWELGVVIKVSLGGGNDVLNRDVSEETVIENALPKNVVPLSVPSTVPENV